MMRVPTEEELVKSGKDYESYAEELTYRFEMMHAAFRDIRIKAAVDLSYKHVLKMKPVKQIEWLQPGKFVVVYRPTSNKDGDNWTKKLLYQFVGPFRISKLFRNAVHMTNLDVMERRWLSAAEHKPFFLCPWWATMLCYVSRR